MIRIAVFADEEAAVYAAKRGIAVYSTDPQVVEVARKNGVGVLFSKDATGIGVFAPDPVEAVRLCILSADVVIADPSSSGIASLAIKMAKLLGKPIVEGGGKQAVEQAIELLVRYNLFGKK